MGINRENINDRVRYAGEDREKKERFLEEEQDHILHLTARLLGRTVTDSSDEYITALMAVSEAIDSYDDKKGSFWSYASLVIKSRIIDEYRAHGTNNEEISVAPEIFTGGSISEEESISISIKHEVEQKTAVYVDNNLKHEIEALSHELEEYGVDLFDLPASSPKSKKTKESCRELINVFFLPPPLVEALKRTKNLPTKELLKRCNVSRKLIDRYRKFLLASIIVKAGDYKEIMEYVNA